MAKLFSNYNLNTLEAPLYTLNGLRLFKSRTSEKSSFIMIAEESYCGEAYAFEALVET